MLAARLLNVCTYFGEVLKRCQNARYTSEHMSESFSFESVSKARGVSGGLGLGRGNMGDTVWLPQCLDRSELCQSIILNA